VTICTDFRGLSREKSVVAHVVRSTSKTGLCRCDRYSAAAGRRLWNTLPDSAIVSNSGNVRDFHLGGGGYSPGGMGDGSPPVGSMGQVPVGALVRKKLYSSLQTLFTDQIFTAETIKIWNVTQITSWFLTSVFHSGGRWLSDIWGFFSFIDRA